jgi:hypothetical protein
MPGGDERGAGDASNSRNARSTTVVAESRNAPRLVQPHQRSSPGLAPRCSPGRASNASTCANPPCASGDSPRFLAVEAHPHVALERPAHSPARMPMTSAATPRTQTSRRKSGRLLSRQLPGKPHARLDGAGDEPPKTLHVRARGCGRAHLSRRARRGAGSGMTCLSNRVSAAYAHMRASSAQSARSRHGGIVHRHGGVG